MLQEAVDMEYLLCDIEDNIEGRKLWLDLHNKSGMGLSMSIRSLKGVK